MYTISQKENKTKNSVKKQAVQKKIKCTSHGIMACFKHLKPVELVR